MLAWLKLIGRFEWRDYKSDNVEIVLGYRDDIGAVYHYEDYIEGRIREFKFLWNTYMLEPRYDYDKDRIRNDLNLLTNLTIFGGEYPHYSEVRICDGFEINDGPGGLRENIKETKGILRDFHNYDEDGIKKLIEEKAKRWVTITFKGFNRSCRHAVWEILNHIKEGHMKNGKIAMNSQCHKCLIPPKLIKDINKEALILSSKYFRRSS